MRARAALRITLRSLIVVTAAIAVAPAAGAGTGTATIAGGTLAFISSPASVSFGATLNGADQTVTSAQAFDIGDATGAGSGWNITATSTTFTTGSKTLSNTGTTVQSAPTVSCDASTTCTVASTNVSYPYTLPAGATAPTATKVFNAAANSGLGNQTVTATFRLAVPASTSAGTYTSTWTYSLVSGP